MQIPSFSTGFFRRAFLRSWRAYLLSLAVLFGLWSCSKNAENAATTPTLHLVSYDPVSTLSASTLKAYAQLGSALGITLSSSNIRYDVKIYKVVYNTTYKGKSIVASGLVMTPATRDALSIVSLHHGTIAANSEAPSQALSSSVDMTLYAALSSFGFITVIPDYIGFGSSYPAYRHPYYVYAPTVSAVTDMLKATKELISLLSLNTNQKLFLTGYSQGGYVTLATHKALEANPLDGFNLVASFPAAGGYDVAGMRKYFWGLTSYSQPFYLAYVMSAYKYYYDWSDPYTTLFQEPYASRVDNLLDGTRTSGEINAQLTTTISSLLTSEALTTFDTGATYSKIVTALNENSLLNWVPTKPIYFYHGDADITVPYQNSVDTYNKLLANGAPAANLHFVTLAGKDHSSGVYPYIELIMQEIMALK